MNDEAKRRLRLFLRDPHCHWCRCETFLPPMGKQPSRDNHATLDHLFERYFGKRDNSVRGERTVLACHKCNHDRGDAYARKLNTELGPDRARMRAEMGHTIKNSIISWKRLLNYQPLNLGAIIDANALT